MALENDEWHAWRRQGIGSSDAPAILGVCPYRTPLDVWLEKTDRASPRSPTIPMRVGLAVESLLLDWVCEQDPGLLLERGKRATDREWPVRRATLDGCSDGLVVEAKSVAHARDDLGEPGTDDVPASWLVQVQHQLMTLDYGLAYIPVLIGKERIVKYVVERHLPLCARIDEAERAFWSLVESDTPPPIDFARDAERVHLIAYPEDDQPIVPDRATHDLIDLWEGVHERLRLQREDVRSSERLERELRARVDHALGTARFATLLDGRVLSRKHVHVKGGIYTRQSYSYSRLTIKDGATGEDEEDE